MAKLIEMPFGGLTHVGAGSHVVDGCRDLDRPTKTFGVSAANV